VAAELDGRRGAWLGFYGLVGLACWAKGPAGLMPLVVVVAYQLAASGWRGLARLRAGMGIAILVMVVAPWWVLAAHAGRGQFVRDVVQSDMMQGYNPLRALAWNRAIEPFGAALTILLPWSLLLPFAVRWAARRWKTHAAAGERLALIWSITVFVVVAASSRQRWRYYLPLCAPGSLLIAGWLWSRGVWRQMAISVTAWAVVASTLVFGEVYVTARDNRGTELRTIARALERVSAPLFALEAPELVFSFYLGRSIPVVSSTAELRGGDPPVYVIARNPSVPEAFDPVAQGFVKGRRFVLWSKQ